jgi:hypothetical protein
MRVTQDLVVCRFKVARVVRIGDGLAIICVAKEAYFGLAALGLHPLQVSHVVGVHSEDVVERVVVLGRDATGEVVGVVGDVALLEQLGRAFMRGFAFVVIGRTARVEDSESIAHAGFGSRVLEDGHCTMQSRSPTCGGETKVASA